MAGRPTGLDHARLWAAIDALAEAAGLSRSGLARRAGLSSTAFNRSKRTTPDGRPRWPSTESIAKLLEATGVDLVGFVRLIRHDDAPGAGTVPPHRRRRSRFAAGHGGGGFSEAPAAPILADAPDLAAPDLFACAVSTLTEIGPYRAGDTIIASRTIAPCRGDRVLVMTHDGRLAVQTFLSRNTRSWEFAPAAGRRRRLRRPVADVVWIARVLWASQ